MLQSVTTNTKTLFNPLCTSHYSNHKVLDNISKETQSYNSANCHRCLQTNSPTPKATVTASSRVNHTSSSLTSSSEAAPDWLSAALKAGFVLF